MATATPPCQTSATTRVGGCMGRAAAAAAVGSPSAPQKEEREIHMERLPVPAALPPSAAPWTGDQAATIWNPKVRGACHGHCHQARGPYAPSPVSRACHQPPRPILPCSSITSCASAGEAWRAVERESRMPPPLPVPPSTATQGKATWAAMVPAQTTFAAWCRPGRALTCGCASVRACV